MNALRILVVEDEAMIAMLMTEVLSDMGHEVCAVAATEDDAVEAALLHKPCLMIVDAHLREGSGVAAVDTIMQTMFIPHIFVSGARIRRRSPEVITLQKPFRETELVLAIGRALATAPLDLPHSPLQPKAAALAPNFGD
jgi:CheY-like chemotaxis protein